MQEIFTSFNILVTLFVGISIIFVYILRNLLLKVEKYEDATVEMQKTIENIQTTITESQTYLQSLDERGVFQSDDEVGTFFESMKQVQQELNQFIDQQDAKKKVQS